MTDEERKALVERLRYRGALDHLMGGVMYQAADQIEADGQRIAELEAALREVFEEWAGSEGFIPETAPEGYLLQLTKKMALIASAALGNKHD